MDIGAWLRSLGLSRYEAAFSDNSIDADVLADLTDGDLAQLGVNLGDRKRLLKAIASLGAPDLAAKPTRPAPLSSSTDAAERRPITVLFCDLVGSTSLAAKLDAEDWRNLVNAYLDEASKAVTGLGGHVLKKLGDGLMALFGYPQAQENDAERAVRAALAIQGAIAEINERNARTGAPAAGRPHRRSKAAPSSSTRQARCSAKRPMLPRAFRRRPSREPCWSLRPSSGRSPGSSSLRTGARTSSRASRRR